MRKVSNFQKLMKGQSSMDVFTEADVHIQNTVVYNLKQLYPRAKLIGEEDESSKMINTTKRPFIEPDQLDKNTISVKMLKNNYERQKHSYRVHLEQLEKIYGMPTPEADKTYYEFPDEFFEDEMVIWIDPLDGTTGFIGGHLNHITCLVGVAIKGRPRIGIIHKPFYSQAI
jgi:fructose-1,6-bisphosphatase/inositol monophosphatase family enzyme